MKFLTENQDSRFGRHHRGALRRSKPSVRRTLAVKVESVHLEPSVTSLSLRRDNLKHSETIRSSVCSTEERRSSESQDSNSPPETASTATRNISQRRSVVSRTREAPIRTIVEAPIASNGRHAAPTNSTAPAETRQPSVSTSNSRLSPLLRRQLDLSVDNLNEYHSDMLLDGAVAAAAMERQQIQIARQLSLAEQQRQEELARGDITPRTMEDIELAIAMSLSQQEQQSYGAIQLSNETEPDMTYETLIQLEDVSVGLTQHTINLLLLQTIDSSILCIAQNTSCTICMTDFKPKDKDVLR